MKTKTPPELSILFKLKPEAAIEYLENKGYKITNDWREMWEDAHAKAFTISKMTDIQLLKDTKNTLEQAMHAGWGAQKTQRELTNMFKKRGWWGKQEIIDENGDVKKIQLGSPHRVRTIYRQNMQSAYNAGRYLKQLENVDFAPYFQYIAVLDEATRPEHRALHGKVFRYDDPIWALLYPPNGWGCRCIVRQLTKDEVQRLGVNVEKSGKNLAYKDEIINENTGETKQVALFKTTDLTGKPVVMKTDAGWSSNTGKAAWNIDVLAFNEVKDMPQNIKDKFISEMAQNTINERVYKNFVKNTIKNDLKAKGLETAITWIKPIMLNKLAKENIKINTPIVVMQDSRIGHIIGDVKTEKQKISEEQLLDLQKIINNPDAVYLDYSKQNSTGIIYIKNLDSKKCIKVCVKLNKFKSKTPVNYISTAEIVEKNSLNNTKVYKKIE